MSEKTLVSIIVPVYNVEEYLARCVDSLVEQTYTQLEILLVDDGSKDNSGKICDEYARKDPRIRVIHKENGGLSSARNAGLDAARGEFVGFVDSDDWVEKDTYGFLLQQCLENGTQLACAGRYDVDGGTGERTVGLCPVKTETVTAEQMLGKIFVWDNCDSSACDKLFHRSLFKDLRFPLNKTSEDVAVMYRVVLAASKVTLCDRPVYNYYHRPNSITTSAFSDKKFHFLEHTAEIYPYIQKNHPAIEPQARYFRVRALLYTLEEYYHADVAGQKKYAAACKKLQKELRCHASFILKSPYFTKRERMHGLLLAAGLYRVALKMYKAVK